jgi:hypothetical protein
MHVVQRLLDEKALKRGSTDKAARPYVDSLCQRVAAGARDGLRQCTSESLSRLRERAANVQAKIADLRRFVQVELHDIETEIAALKHAKAGPAGETERRLSDGTDGFSYTVAGADVNP